MQQHNNNLHAVLLIIQIHLLTQKSAYLQPRKSSSQVMYCHKMDEPQIQQRF